MAPVLTPSSSGFAEPFSSNLERVGRDGFLGLRFEQRRGKTALTQCRFKVPLQALALAELADGTPYLMLLNPTGGVLGGDFLLMQIALGADTGVCLTTPSATRVYRTQGQPAVQNTEIMIGEGASLEYLPDHIIPYKHSDFQQSLRVEMGRGSRAVFWDALAAGRVAHGERWNFQEFDSHMEITLCGHKLFLSRTRIRPSDLDPEQLGFAERFGYLATFVIVADKLENWEETTAAMNAELRNMPRVYGGASTLARNGCVVKLLAPSASDLTAAQAALWGRARQLIFGSGAVSFRK
jgi:urease accessory protein